MNTPKLICFILLLSGLPIYSHAQKTVPKDGFIQLKGGTYPLGKENIPITLSPFAISPTEVTYGQMSLFAFQYPERYHSDEFGWTPDAERAAVNVDWFDAIRYTNWLSEQKGLGAVYTVYGDVGVLNPEDKSYWDDKSWARVDFDITKKGYRLPTEAEWEYAASGYEALGRKQEYFGTDDSKSLKEYTLYRENSGGEAHKTATLRPNANGIYDMGGNVSEWCFDEFDREKRDDILKTFKNQKNPVFQNTKMPYNTYRSIRGGGWESSNFIFFFQMSIPTSDFASNDDNINGFRLVRTL